ncbi:CE1 family esterase [Ferruginibacter sp.]
MKKWTLSATLLFITAALSAQQNIDATLQVSSTQRQYLLHLPTGYTAGKAWPLVIVFHGGGGNYKQMQRYMGMDAIADNNHFIIVYPNGVDKQWNDGREFKPSISANDDVEFINQLLDTLQKNYSIDKKRVFATGISNGGFFSIYLSYKLSNRLLAVAPVCASIPERILSEFYPAQPVSVLLINGTGDPLVPYNGGSVGNKLIGKRGNCTSTDTTIQRYIQVNHTGASAAITELPDNEKRDQCTATQYLYSGGSNHTRVCLIKISNGGHTLPGGSQYLPRLIIGKVCNDFKGNEMIWKFFSECPNK